MRRIGAMMLGLLLSAMPAVALAQEGREVPPPSDAGLVILLTALGLGAFMLLAGIIYMIRRQLGLEWDFQKPDEAHGEHVGAGTH